MTNEKKKNPTMLTLLFLFVFFPLGAYFLWKKTNWSNSNRVALTIICGFMFIGILSGFFKPTEFSYEIKDLTTNESINITGTADEGSTELLINGQQVIIENDKFNYSIPLKMGLNQIKMIINKKETILEVKRVSEAQLKREQKLAERKRRLEEKKAKIEEEKRNMIANCQSNPELVLKQLKHSWKSGGFGTTAEHWVYVYNPCSISIKDVKFRATYFASSGTKIDSLSKIVYQVIKAKRKKWFKFSGFKHSQAASSSIEIKGATAMR